MRFPFHPLLLKRKLPEEVVKNKLTLEITKNRYLSKLEACSSFGWKSMEANVNVLLIQI